jgi:DNA-binding NarL/FixJ family response regulator
MSDTVIKLSTRQSQVLAMIGQGAKDREIAITLGLSYNTVRVHVARLYKKLAHVGGRTKLLSRGRNEAA